MQRLNILNKQFNQNNTVISDEKITLDGKTYAETIDHHPSKQIKMQYTKLNGWGYKDSGFKYIKEKDACLVLGNRYMFGGQHLPEFHQYFKKEMDIDVDANSDAQTDIEID